VKKKLESGFVIEDQYPASNVSAKLDAKNSSDEDYSFRDVCLPRPYHRRAESNSFRTAARCSQ
jgi:hypothetical protein